MSPRFSIIIPTYNVEKYITRCLESCINQTYKDIEIIVVDDRGSDKSIEIAKNYASKDARIKIVENIKNLGTFHTRIEGIKVANGEYILFLDADDYIELNTCEVLDRAIQDSGADMIHYKIEHTPKSIVHIAPKVKCGYLYDKDMRYFLSTGNNSQSTCDKAIKSSIAKKARASLSFVDRPLLMLEDGLFILVASMEAHSYYGIDSALYHYCANPTSITRQQSRKNFKVKIENGEYLLDILTKLESMYPKHKDLIQKYKQKVVSVIIINTRNMDFDLYLQALQIVYKHGYDKQNFPQYLSSCLLSIRYAYRWQNLIRIILFICSFGRIKI